MTSNLRQLVQQKIAEWRAKAVWAERSASAASSQTTSAEDKENARTLRECADELDALGLDVPGVSNETLYQGVTGDRPSRASHQPESSDSTGERVSNAGERPAPDTKVGVPAPLFQSGEFTLYSGERSTFKIDCDALGVRDYVALSNMLRERIAPFSRVEGVPRGGLTWAETLRAGGYCSESGPVLIVDDVLTTGASMERQRAGRDAIGAVIFARGKCPPWVTPLFQLADVVPAPGGETEKK